MVILPFTRPKWHVQGLTLFGLGSFWMGQWGWYSATGLLLASVATNELLGAELKMGLKISKERRIPYWAVALTAASVGIAMKYAFVVRPRFLNSLLYLHPYLDLAENFSRAEYIAEGPYPRLDDWFIIVAIMTVVELFESAKFYLSFKPLVWLGERSFSKRTHNYQELKNERLTDRQAFLSRSASSSGRPVSSCGLRWLSKRA